MLIINLQGSEAFQIRTKPLLIKLNIFLRVFCFVNHQHFNQPCGVNGSFADLDLTAMHKNAQRQQLLYYLLQNVNRNIICRRISFRESTANSKTNFSIS